MRLLRRSIWFRAMALCIGLFLAFGILEFYVRVFRPAPPVSPFRFDLVVGYEFKPAGKFKSDTMNQSGFRNAEKTFVKPLGVRRILAIGDSVCYSVVVDREHSWAHLIEQNLNAASQGGQIEVLNAGTPGHVSLQALQRLRRRGMKFQPDIVVVLVGWDDLFFASLPEWRPNVTMAHLPMARDYLKMPTILGSRFLGVIYGRIKAWRYPSWRYQNPSSSRQDSGILFNEAALRIYLNNLGQIRETILAGEATMAVVVWPTVLTLKPYGPDIDEKLKVMFSCFPLSLREFEYWYGRYREGILDFASRYPDTILIDPTADFQSARDCSGLFFDLCHLSKSGNALLAKTISEKLMPHLDGASD